MNPTVPDERSTMLYPLGQTSPAQASRVLPMPLQRIEYPCLPIGPLNEVSSIDMQPVISTAINYLDRSNFTFI
jgi:hypothetical protein